jgi:hypothetical protein
MREYMILNASARVTDVFEYIKLHKFRVEVHLNRTRFWVPDGVELTEFILKFGDVCTQVDPLEDRLTGRLNG